MTGVLLAGGAAATALKRYDPGLRARWSWEKRKWCVDAPARRQDMLTPPVFFERVGEADHWIERLLPEKSDRYISYRDHRYIVCWSPHLDNRLVEAIIRRDAARYHKGFVGAFNENLRARNAALLKRREKVKEERVYEAWDRFKHDLRRNPNAEDGAGVSIRGWKPRAELAQTAAA